MIKQILGVLAASTLLVYGCGDKPAPTQPSLQPTPFPTPSVIPVVTSVEPTNRYDTAHGWIIRGSHFLLDEKVTFESCCSETVMALEDQGLSDFIGVSGPALPSGKYIVCVETFRGKGCSRFLVTVHSETSGQEGSP